MDDRDVLLMTPGPTALPDRVRDALARPIHNPDVEPEFAAFYGSLLEKVADVYRTDDDVVVLGGEGILALEAAVASLIDPGEAVLCLANGIYGDGFADFVEMYGGDPHVHRIPPDQGFDVAEIESLVTSRDFVAATAVHCETPTGVLNDLEEVLAVLDDAGVLSIVDAVSSVGGAPVPVEDIDVCIAGSQKCLSSPPGLTTVSVSDDAWAKVEATTQDTFYTSLSPWRDIEIEADSPVFLPYTPLVSNLYALDASLDLVLEEGLDAVHDRHETAAERCRERGRALGLDPFPGSEALCSPTVTAFEVDGSAGDLQRTLRSDHGIVLATGLGEYEDDILRIGHMGYNATVERVDRTMDALASVLEGR